MIWALTVGCAKCSFSQAFTIEPSRAATQK
jgi:hypothetical protein